MRLLRLFEFTDDIWYHGTPEIQKLSMGFEGRTTSVIHLSDPKRFEELQQQLQQVERESPEYMKMLDEIGDLKVWKTVRSPIFLSDTYSIANTYADDRRAYDYQAAEPGVVQVHVKPANTLTVNAHGQDFRGITVDSLVQALRAAKIDNGVIQKELAQFGNQIRGDGNKLSTDHLSAIVDDLEFDIVDVRGVKDTYMGGGPPATVRMVMDPKLIQVIDPKKG